MGVIAAVARVFHSVEGIRYLRQGHDVGEGLALCRAYLGTDEIVRVRA